MEMQNSYAEKLNINKDLFGWFTSEIGTASMIGLFIILNVLKISLFNIILLPSYSMKIFIYKFIVTLLVFVPINLLLLKARKPHFLILCYILQSLYICINTAYYLYYHDYIYLETFLSLFSEGFIAAIHSHGFLSEKLLVSLIDFPLFMYIVLRYSFVKNLISNKKKAVICKRSLTFICIVLLLMVEFRNYEHNFSIFLFKPEQNNLGVSIIVSRYGTITNSIIDILKNSNENDLLNNIKYSDNTYSSKGNATSTKPNFILLQVESLSANIVNQKYRDEYIAPFLHSLEDSSIYYPYTMSYHKGGGTSDSEFSVINSVETLDNYPAIKIRNNNYPNSFIKALNSSKYVTSAFHGYLGGYYNRDNAFSAMGFNEFFDINRMGLSQVGWGAPDQQLFKYMENKTSSQEGPYLDYIITISSHTPFTYAQGYGYNNSLFDDIETPEVKAYYNSISYVDNCIKDFVTYVRQNYKNTYVFIWGDHTPGIDKNLYKSSSITLDDRYFEFVPLYIITPDNKIRKESEKAATFLDIAPTVLDASGIEFNIKTQGENLINNSSLQNSIPFRGKSYDRSYLFKQISEKENYSGN
jgi:Phosphoglycerol transferase and related proteins, alkaline phosphatase superfamily